MADQQQHGIYRRARALSQPKGPSNQEDCFASRSVLGRREEFLPVLLLLLIPLLRFSAYRLFTLLDCNPFFKLEQIEKRKCVLPSFLACTHANIGILHLPNCTEYHLTRLAVTMRSSTFTLGGIVTRELIATPLL